jgi:hypothetical protein
MNRVLVELESAEDAISEVLGEYNHKEAQAVFIMAAKVLRRLQTLTTYVWPVDRWTRSERHEGAHECGNCGALALKIGGPYGGEVLTRFCPWCGAQMELPKEAEE